MGFSAYAQPTIIGQPANQLDLPLGITASFSVNANGTGPLKYQWRLNGVNIPGANNSSITVAGVQATDCGNYTVAVADITGVTSSKIARLTVVIPSITGNDSFSNRFALNPYTNGAVRSDNSNASREQNEPNHAGKPGGRSIWFKWTPLTSGIVTFQTLGSGFDTLLAAYTGDAVGALTPVPSSVNDDDSGGFLTSKISFNAVALTEYEIAVDGFAGASGDVVVTWNFELTPELLPTITSFSANQTVSNESPFSLEFTSDFGQGLWFLNGQSLSLIGPRMDVAKCDDTAVGSYFVQVTSSQGRKNITRRSRIQINIQKDGSANTNATWNKFLDSVTAAPPPLKTRRPYKGGGDSQGYSTSQIFSTVGSTKEPGEPDHCGETGGSSEWYVYVAQTNGLLHVNTDGSGFNTIIAVYVGPGDSFSTLTNVGCGKTTNYLVNGQPHVYVNAQSNTTYYIAVDGVNGASGAVHLNINLGNPVSINTPPASQTVVPGTNVSFTVSVSGSTPVSYAWQFNGTNVSGGSTSILNLSNVQTAQAGTYSIRLSNLVSVVNSAATLSVLQAPGIATQPANLTVNVGSNAVYSCVATGSVPLNYQWRFGNGGGPGGNLAGATNSSLTITNAQSSNAGNYRCIVSNIAGTASSSVATLTVNTPAAITTPPASQTVTPGSNVTLTVVATGTPSPAYQWQFNGADTGGNNSALALLSFQAGNEGTYRVVVSNSLATVTSANAILALNAPLRFGPGAMISNNFQAQLIGIAGSNYIVEGSTNLLNWVSLRTNTATNGFLNLFDPGSSNYPYRFYRGVGGP
jgi:hypothetical protein